MYGIVQLDVVGSSERDAALQRRMRDDLYAMVRRVLAGQGVSRHDDVPVDDRGDELRLIVPETAVPLERLVDVFVAGLTVELREHARAVNPVARIRLRVCFDLGVLVRHHNGWAGDALVRVARLIEAEPLRAALRDNPDLTFAAVLSEDLFRQVIQQRLGHLDPDSLRPIHVSVKNFQADAWLLVPEGATLSRQPRPGSAHGTGEPSVGRPEPPAQRPRPTAAADSVDERRPSWDVLMRLVELVLDVSAMADENGRNLVVRQLRPSIRGAIRRQSVAKFDVLEILTTCFDYPGGAQELIDMIRLLSGDSIPVRRLVQAMRPYLATPDLEER